MKKILTLDIGACNVTLAEYALGKGVPTLVNYGMARLVAPVDTGDAATILGPAIMEIVREKGIRPGPVVVSLAGQMAFPRVAPIASAGGSDKFEQMVRYEIEQNVPFPIDEMICDRQVLGETANGEKNVLIVAAKTEQVEAITDAIAGVGFRPEVVDVAPIAYTNAVKAATGEDGCIVLLDIGAKTTSLVIAEGGNIYGRAIPIAGNNITREIAQALGCTTEEAEQLKLERGYVSLGGVSEDADEVSDRMSKVCRTVLSRLLAEINRSVNFYRSQQGGGTPVRLYLTGGTALLPQLDQFFAESLQLEVAYFNPFDYVSVGSGLDAEAMGADGAFLAPTVGLALHAAGSAELVINLLPPSLVAVRADRAKIPLVAGAGVALLAGLALVWLSVGKEEAALSSADETVGGRLSQLQNFQKKVKAGEEQVAAAQGEAEKLRRLMASRGNAVAQVKAVRGAMGPGMWIEKWEDGKVTIRGWKDRIAEYVKAAAAANGGKSQTASELVVASLKGSPAVVAESVKIADMTEIGLNAQVQQFTVELKFK